MKEFISPTKDKSACFNLFISDSSISMWIILALGQNLVTLPTALSSNLTPKAIIKSA
ncbi:hypothetical protein D3C73_1646000 [compost metagenome]